MARISKDPETRRRELIDTAERLFLDKGYNDTTISDIVKAAAVAQGTFYYYFKTKDEIIDAIADDYLMETRKIADEVAARGDLNAIQKMLTISASFTGMIKNKKGIVVSLHEDRNAQLHVKVERKSMAVLLEPYKKIVTQGIEEGHFNTDHPEESILTMIAMSSAILDTPDEVAEVAERPFLPKASGLTKQMESNVEALFDITERILGAKKGIFRQEAEKMKK